MKVKVDRQAVDRAARSAAAATDKVPFKSPRWAGPLVCEIFLPGGSVVKLFSNASQFVGHYYHSPITKARGGFARRFEIHMGVIGKRGGL